MNKRILLLTILISLGLAQEWFVWEGDVYRSIHEEMQCRLLDYLNDGVQVTSDLSTNLTVPLVLFSVGGEREHRAAKLAAASLALSAVTVTGLKAIVNRQRPEENSPRWDSSFPSGHTTVAMSTAIAYRGVYPKLSVPLSLYCGFVGFSRVYAGEHYPTDVIGGAVLGAGIGILVVKLQEAILAFP